ncbi:uncharacterized protein LOC121973883 [Zingiber officinale]|uniref:BAH domain-containing protein n=1 Tax=Zingiber officinale TaxID=94328 RepID=A0A8J5HP55_ZINOF|nr:uncharacterized protein LOC121973883 [Zingiber officinale]KAG6532968.1 hypothetical protein ZIOFF_006828 [Zingiber officinale]
MEEARGAYVLWQEVVVSNDKGRRVVHYYLKGAGGGADLAVVGREKSVRHMSYTVPNQFARSLMSRPHLMPSLPSSSSPQPPGLSFKLRSRREVVDWLSSLVSDPLATASSITCDRYGDADIYEPGDMPDFKFPSKKTRHCSSEFQWLGAPWQCKKRKRHYRSFSKNGVTISVHDFVFVMVEENNRLVAYVDDLYEDLQGHNMVVVRWFHKVDEVGIVLPPDTNDREIFFSLCLQDFSVECIDGLAAVLSAQHFEQFQNEARLSTCRPYMCRRQINNDGVKPFDITQLQGYWSQDLVRSMPIFTSPFKLRLKIKCGNSSLSVVRKSDNNSLGSLKRMTLTHPEDRHSAESSARNKMRPTSLSVSSKFRKCATKTLSGSALIRKELFKQKLQQQFCAGYHVEVLSQDSGMRGCWFRCVILKRHGHQDKAKVRYLDIQDPDEKGNLEEWVSLSRVAVPDKFGVRNERPIVRPNPAQCDIIPNFEIGAIVDAWQHDGWWEGIMIRKESDGRLHVYFPGEDCFSIFSEGELRQSQDWICNKWNVIPKRVDIAISLSLRIKDPTGAELTHSKAPSLEHLSKVVDNSPANTIKYENTSSGDSSSDKDANSSDLTSGFQFKLKWSTSRKRKHRREVMPDDVSSPLKKQHCQTSSSGSENSEEQDACGGSSFALPKSLAVDRDNCKTGSDHIFKPPLSSLVMSQ